MAGIARHPDYPRSAVGVRQVSGQCTTLLAQAPYDGCFVDMLGDASLGASYLTSQPINPATDAVWTQEQQLTATTAIAQTVTADHPNDIIMANGLLNGASCFSPTAPTSQLFGGVNTALAESWLRAATNAVTRYESPALWQQDVNVLSNSGGNGDAAAVTTKVWITATAAQLTALQRLALASFLLGTTGDAYFSFTQSQSPTEFQTDAGNPLDHTQLGAALDPYAAFGRQYADADVIVNPTKKPVTVAIPTPCLTLDGVLATTSLLMPADSGQIARTSRFRWSLGVSPSAGPAAGGTSVTIAGSGFSSATSVNFGAGNPASFSVISDTEIDATSAAGSGTVDITVISPGGTSSTSGADEFTPHAPMMRGSAAVVEDEAVDGIGAVGTVARRHVPTAESLKRKPDELTRLAVALALARATSSRNLSCINQSISDAETDASAPTAPFAPIRAGPGLAGARIVITGRFRRPLSRTPSRIIRQFRLVDISHDRCREQSNRSNPCRGRIPLDLVRRCLVCRRTNPGLQDTQGQNYRCRHCTRPWWLTAHYRHALG